MEGPSRVKEKDKTKMSFSSGCLKETTPQPDKKGYGIALKPYNMSPGLPPNTDREHAVFNLLEFSFQQNEGSINHQ